MPYVTPNIYKWKMRSPELDLQLREDAGSQRPAPWIVELFREVVEENNARCRQIYTDGSKTAQGVGAAAVGKQECRKATLPGIASIYSAELHAIQLALEIIDAHKYTRSLVCSDSLSSLVAIKNSTNKIPLVLRVQQKLHRLEEGGSQVTFLWVPGHSGIGGNDAADTIAKKATQQPPQFITVPYTDWYSYIRDTTMRQWEDKWSRSTAALHHIKPKPEKWRRSTKTRREEVIMNRLRLGHTRLTHGYLFDGEPQRRICRWCNDAFLTVEHLLITCPQLEQQRGEIIRSRIGESTLQKLLGERANHKIIMEYLKKLAITGEI